MSDVTPNLALPFILPAQAQKHVTHNEALLGLDATVQLVLASQSSVPPVSPVEGERHFVLPAASGAWTGKAGKIAAWQDGVWQFLTPKPGWQAFDATTGSVRLFDSETWIAHTLSIDGSIAAIGINTTPDSTNRLAIAAPATLFSHEGAGHQLKLNKASAADTGSLLFQTNWQGRAELGLAGSDEFALKVSDDGVSWTTALSVGADGIARTGNRPAVRAARTPLDQAPAAGSLTGFNTLLDARGSFALGPESSSGSGHRLIVPAAGHYLVGLSICVLASSGHSVRLVRNGTTPIVTIEGTAGSGPTTQQVLALANFDAGDWLAVEHLGAATLRFGPQQTEVLAAMI